MLSCSTVWVKFGTFYSDWSLAYFRKDNFCCLKLGIGSGGTGCLYRRLVVSLDRTAHSSPG